MDESIVVGIDIGTSKICTLIGRVEEDERIRILGVGIESAKGMKKGTVIDLNAAAQAIARSIDKAERSSGLEVTSALVSLAGANMTAVNSTGFVNISGRGITEEDIYRAMDAAQAVEIPHNREVIHVIQRSFTVDGQEGVKTPVGMHGYRLEVEAHIITAPSSTVENLRQCVSKSGVEISQFVLNPLAAGEIVLTEAEREMGVAVCDIGSGTTDLAIYIEGDIWHTSVLSLAGDLITSDIAHGLRLDTEQAEKIKIRHGHADEEMIPPEIFFTVRPFGGEEAYDVLRKDLGHIIGARVEEIFSLVLQEIKRSGYEGLLPAGIVLTGGSSGLSGIRNVANRTLEMPVRIAAPKNLDGMVDKILSPEYSTSVGLLHWALLMNEIAVRPRRRNLIIGGPNWDRFREILRRLLP